MFPQLVHYLSHSGSLAWLQLSVMIALIYVLLDRLLRLTGRFGPPLPGDRAVAGPTAQALTQICVGFGLLLTFSGVYQMITAGNQNDQDGLSLALGSSALGYSAWVFCSFGSLADSFRKRVTPENIGRKVTTQRLATAVCRPKKDGSRRETLRSVEKQTGQNNESQSSNDTGSGSRCLGNSVRSAKADGDTLGSLTDHQR